MQPVFISVVADDIQVVHMRLVCLSSQFNREGYTCINQEILSCEPFIRYFYLSVVFKFLSEKSEVIIQTDAIASHIKCGNGIQETCSKSAKATIAKGWFGFHLLDG